MNLPIGYLLWIWISTFYASTIDTEHFDVVFHGKTVGELIATKSKIGDNLVYKNSTKIKTQIVREVLVNYQFQVTFNEGKLTESDATILVNDRIHEQTKTIKTEHGYHIKYHDEKDKFLNNTIDYSSVMLMFEEPKGITASYSELEGDLHTLTPLGNHAYNKMNNKRKVNTYYYKNGKLDRAEINAGIIKFKLQRSKR